MNAPTAFKSRWAHGQIDVPVYYEDTDFTGYVYHANYLKYFERGREELLSLALVRSLYERGVHFVVGKAVITYKAPARHGDILRIETRLYLSDSTVTTVQHRATKLVGDSSESDLVMATVKLASVDGAGKTKLVSRDVLDELDRRLPPDSPTL